MNTQWLLVALVLIGAQQLIGTKNGTVYELYSPRSVDLVSRTPQQTEAENLFAHDGLLNMLLLRPSLVCELSEEALQSITMVDFFGNDLGYITGLPMRHFASALGCLPNVRKLDLSHCGLIGVRGLDMVWFAQAIGTLTSVEHLCLTSNSLAGMDYEDLQMLCDGFKKLLNMQRLDFACCLVTQVDFTTMDLLAKSLLSLPNIRILVASKNDFRKFSYPAILSFVDAVLKLENLEEIEFGNNHFDALGKAELACMVKLWVTLYQRGVKIKSPDGGLIGAAIVQQLRDSVDQDLRDVCQNSAIRTLIAEYTY